MLDFTAVLSRHILRAQWNKIALFALAAFASFISFHKSIFMWNRICCLNFSLVLWHCMCEQAKNNYFTICHTKCIGSVRFAIAMVFGHKLKQFLYKKTSWRTNEWSEKYMTCILFFPVSNVWTLSRCLAIYERFRENVKTHSMSML